MNEIIFGMLSGIFTIIFYVVYVHSILKGETKPHIFTALLYAIFTGILFSILALTQLNFITSGYLFYIMIFNIIMFLIIFCRRRVIMKTKN